MRNHIKKIVLAAVCTSLGALAGAYASSSVSAAQVSAENLRFRLVGDEPIAGPDGRSLTPGWKVIVLRDMKSGQCYVSFVAGSAMSTNGPSVCP